MNPDVAITVCIASVRAGTLPAAIASVRRQTWQDWEMVVVGQGQDVSVRDVCAGVTAVDRRVRYVHAPQKGLSHARNVAMAQAHGQVLAFLDDDCEAQGDWLDVLAGMFAQDASVEMAFGALIAPEMPKRLFVVCPAKIPAETVYDPVADGFRPPSGFNWIGGDFAMRRRLIPRLGEFDPSLGPGTAAPVADDIDYFLRAERLGVKMASSPRVVVHHTHGVRVGPRQCLALTRGYDVGNGTLAAKLTLNDDPRGREWVATAKRELLTNAMRWNRLYRLPLGALRAYHFLSAYHNALRRFRVDKERQWLTPIN